MGLDLDLADNVSGVVTAIIAVGSLAAVVLRRRGSWWRDLRPFWTARRHAAGAGDYRFEPFMPALLESYVERRATARDRPAAPPVPTDGLVLAGTEHVLLIGPPGSGKTALVRQAVAASALRWLRTEGRLRRAPAEPLVVSLTAVELVHRTLQEAVAAACRPWTPDLDREPLPHRRLVVLVDGLDAVVDAASRSDLIHRLAREARSEPRHWRLVVTTRELDERELSTLGAFHAYDLTPFTPDDVALLAAAWFPGDAPKAAAFLTWLESEPLGAAARGPLLTAVAATTWEHHEPEALTDRFLGMLFEARRAAVDRILTDLRRPPGQEAATAVTDWLDLHRRELLETAARAARARTDVVAAVVAWIGASLPGSPPVLGDERWRQRLPALLTATGVVRAGRDGLTSAWPGLTAFLATDERLEELHRIAGNEQLPRTERGAAHLGIAERVIAEDPETRP